MGESVKSFVPPLYFWLACCAWEKQNLSPGALFGAVCPCTAWCHRSTLKQCSAFLLEVVQLQLHGYMVTYFFTICLAHRKQYPPGLVILTPTTAVGHIVPPSCPAVLPKPNQVGQSIANLLGQVHLPSLWQNTCEGKSGSSCPCQIY